MRQAQSVRDSAPRPSQARYSGSYWAPAPNRHVTPFLTAARASGLLRTAYFARERLAATQQLGTAPAVDSSGEWKVLPEAERSARVVRRRLREDGAEFHLIYSFGPVLSRTVMSECSRLQLPFFVWAESLQPRAAWSPRRLLRDSAYARSLKNAAGAFALSRAAARDLARLGVPRARIFPALYPGPSDVEPNNPAGRPGGGTHVVVFCGRLIPIKGLDVLVSSIALLVSEGHSLELHVVGDGPLRGFTRPLHALGVHVVMHGAVPSECVIPIIRRASTLVLPTLRREGWGYVVNEAYAAGIPVVVSDVAGACEIIAPGRTGVVSKSGDPADLARAIAAASRLTGGDTAAALREIRQSIAADRYAAYVDGCVTSVLGGGAPPEPPWHVAINRLGGNEQVLWWERWRGGLDV
jgi:glycosyltransferase involved in cell wall biosynthesis